MLQLKQAVQKPFKMVELQRIADMNITLEMEVEQRREELPQNIYY